MRAPLKGMLFATVGLTAVAACATTNEYLGVSDDDAGTTVVPDATVTDAAIEDADAPAEDAAEEASSDALLCSTEGWCSLPLPDPYLSMVDVWPLEHRGFALGKNPFFGTKVLEWSEATKAWAYLDDETQNEVGDNQRMREPTSIWSPNDDEVYFAVSSATSGYVYHGKRPSPPETKWSWTRSLFEGCSEASLWVYGTSSDDVFVGACNRIYRKGDAPAFPGDDAGAPDDAGVPGSVAPEGWTLEHVDVSSPGRVLFLGASGTGPNDIWFGGGRLTTSNIDCALLLHRTATGYETVVDSDVSTPSRCTAKPGILSLSGSLRFLQQTGTDRLIAFHRAQTAVRIIPKDGGGYVSKNGKTAPSGAWRTAWAASEQELWLAPNLSVGQVFLGTDLWEDAAAYKLSSIALNGAPILSTIMTIRGTSKKNIWAVGGNHVFRKTTP